MPLTLEENERLTRVGPGTPLGELFRRYWNPVAATGELEKNPVLPVKLLGEELTLFRDKSGRLGLVADRCAHRCVQLRHGIPEIEGLRCMYHGWMYDTTGQCVEQPAEPPNSTFRDEIRIKAYPVEEIGGLIFAYMGPDPVPYLPHWDRLTWPNAVHAIGIHELRGNWMQCTDNSCDLHHARWTHGAYWSYLMDQAGFDDPEDPRRTLSKAYFDGIYVKTRFDRTPLGLTRRMLFDGMTEEHDLWRVGQPHVFPNMGVVSIQFGRGWNHNVQWRVPLDDYTTRNYFYFAFEPGPGVDVPEQESVPCYEVPLYNLDGSLSLDSISSQDALAFEAQGLIEDRTQEHLATSDTGVVALRKLLLEEMEKVQRGQDPMNTFRDFADAEHVSIPVPEQPDGQNALNVAATYKRGAVTNGFVFDDELAAYIEDLFEKAAIAYSEG